jgi:hypothetical protein
MRWDVAEKKQTVSNGGLCAFCKQPIDWSWKNGEPQISVQIKANGRISKFAHASCETAHFWRSLRSSQPKGNEPHEGGRG